MAEARIFGYVPISGLQFPEQTRLLRLRIVAAHHLCRRSALQTSDPYVKISLVTNDGGKTIDSISTKTKFWTRNPKWNEEFVFRVKPSEHKFIMEVFDRNRLSEDEFMGKVVLPLDSLPIELPEEIICTRYYVLQPRFHRFFLPPGVRCKIKGHLELYHAYIFDPNEVEESSRRERPSAAASQSNSEEPESREEMVDLADVNNSSGQDQVEQPARPLYVQGASSTAGVLNTTLPATSPTGWEEQQDANGRTYGDGVQGDIQRRYSFSGNASPPHHPDTVQRLFVDAAIAIIDDRMGDLNVNDSLQPSRHSVTYTDGAEQVAVPYCPYSRVYQEKYHYFTFQLLSQKRLTTYLNDFEITIRRASIMEDSYKAIASVARPDLLKNNLFVKFEGEDGLDHGGLVREWFFLLSTEILNPRYGLFKYCTGENYTLEINPRSKLCCEDHLEFFNFFGRVAGMAVYHGNLLNGSLSRPFYKMVLKKTVDLEDLENVDPIYYNELVSSVVENDPSDLYVPFALDEVIYGKTVSHELKPGGLNIFVTNDNKLEYLNLAIQWRLVSRVQDQMDAFLDGFHCLIPFCLLEPFDERELEWLMFGITTIDVSDWKNNTIYKGGYNADDNVIQWFWKVVLTFSPVMRRRLLQFVTGTSRVPANGFQELEVFTIKKWGTPENLPCAHTCFNRLDLPPYESMEQLKKKLAQAIEESEGFGLI